MWITRGHAPRAASYPHSYSDPDLLQDITQNRQRIQRRRKPTERRGLDHRFPDLGARSAHIERRLPELARLILKAQRGEARDCAQHALLVLEPRAKPDLAVTVFDRDGI